MTLLCGAIDACMLGAWLCAGFAGSGTGAAQVCLVAGRALFGLAVALGCLDIGLWVWPHVGH